MQEGDRYGHLVIIERVERDGLLKGYRCRCTAEREGAECGNVVVKKTSYLCRDGKFRACKSCVNEHLRKARREFTIRHYAGKPWQG